jgi:hypothetical protein
MLIELPIMTTQLIEQEGDKKLFSFNDFITNITPELHNIKFKRTDTNELLGCFLSVYSPTHNIHAKLNGGIINFVYELPNYRRQTIIYGDTIDLNSKIFISY